MDRLFKYGMFTRILQFFVFKRSILNSDLGNIKIAINFMEIKDFGRVVLKLKLHKNHFSNKRAPELLFFNESVRMADFVRPFEKLGCQRCPFQD